jgi:hypothetical protein
MRLVNLAVEYRLIVEHPSGCLWLRQDLPEVI